MMIDIEERQPQEKLLISRKWAMPNKKTFTIKPIADIILKYKAEEFIEPFPYPYQKDALDFLSGFKDNSVEGVLFDPPYSPRQLKECYDSQGMVLHDTKSSVWAKWKDEIARVIKPNGLCLSFGWSSQGLGKNRGFEIIEIMLVAHGGNHNDTIVVVERKNESHFQKLHASDDFGQRENSSHVALSLRSGR